MSRLKWCGSRTASICVYTRLKTTRFPLGFTDTSRICAILCFHTKTEEGCLKIELFSPVQFSQQRQLRDHTVDAAAKACCTTGASVRGKANELSEQEDAVPSVKYEEGIYLSTLRNSVAIQKYLKAKGRIAHSIIFCYLK